MPPERLTVEELQAFTEAARNEEGARKLLLLTILGAGPRLDEVVNLLAEDVSLAHGHLNIRHPLSDVSRQVPLPEPLLTKLGDHIKGRGSEYLFGGLDGGRITADQVCWLVRQTAEEAGIERRVSVHEIRRSVVDQLLKRDGVTNGEIGAFLGVVGTETISVPKARWL